MPKLYTHTYECINQSFGNNEVRRYVRTLVRTFTALSASLEISH